MFAYFEKWYNHDVQPDSWLAAKQTKRSECAILEGGEFRRAWIEVYPRIKISDNQQNTGEGRCLEERFGY
ncbi:MAG: hypothetical protein HPY76_08325 [Anaerolineae bacterium]|nr:hypothetical protein [Anaerolineae bacterium]